MIIFLTLNCTIHGIPYKCARHIALNLAKFIELICFGRNEAEVGKAIRESGVKREDVFVVTKLADEGHGYEECLEAVDTSLNK